MVTSRLLVLILPSLLLSPAAMARPPYTVAQIMSAPLPSRLVARHGKGAVAWVRNNQGVRNIWVAAPPGYRGRELTRYRSDDGQALSHLQFVPEGRQVVYVRGGSPNRNKEVPNPASVPTERQQEIWFAPVDGNEPRRLAVGGSPRVSPRGGVVAFIKDKEVYSLTIAGSSEPAKLFQPRGAPGSLRWSPDGSRLAFVSDRGDHRLIGVYDLERRALRYLDPSIDLDISPVWSPDGKRLAFIRTASEPAVVPFVARRRGPPWSIRVVDLATGASRTVWTAPEGAGSVFREIEAEDQLFWAAGDRLVFPWEGQGWTHLYSVPLRRGAATLLTPGAFEVEHVTLSADREQVIFSSNQSDLDRRHLWRVPAKGGRPTPVTTGRGIEWSPRAVATGRAVAFFASDARHPAHAMIKIGSEPPRPLVRNWLPADFPLAALVEPEAKVFPAEDGLQIHGQLFRPKSSERGKRHPAVVFLHGGSRRQMLLGWHYRGYYHHAYAFNQLLASRGFVVLAVNFRSGTGYGMEFREAQGYGAGGASEFQDVVGAARYLASRADVDARRIGLWGGSYGGYLTALGLARASNLFAAGVDLHGVHDWNVVIRHFHAAYDPALRSEVARLAFESSPMASIKTWRSPVLVIHGDDDRNVPFGETVRLVAALRRQGVMLEQLVLPDEVHSFLLHRNWLRAYEAALDFLTRKLAKS